MEITINDLDRRLENLQNNIAGQIQAQTRELKTYIHESFETQQDYIDERFHELFDSMKVKEDVTRLKRDMSRIKAALHLS